MPQDASKGSDFNPTSRMLFNGGAWILMFTLGYFAILKPVSVDPYSHVYGCVAPFFGFGCWFLGWSFKRRKLQRETVGELYARMALLIVSLGAMLSGVSLHLHSLFFMITFSCITLLLIGVITLPLINLKFAQYVLTDGDRSEGKLGVIIAEIDIVPVWQPIVVYALIFIVGMSPELIPK